MLWNPLSSLGNLRHLRPAEISKMRLYAHGRDTMQTDIAVHQFRSRRPNMRIRLRIPAAWAKASIITRLASAVDASTIGWSAVVVACAPSAPDIIEPRNVAREPVFSRTLAAPQRAVNGTRFRPGSAIGRLPGIMRLEALASTEISFAMPSVSPAAGAGVRSA